MQSLMGNANGRFPRDLKFQCRARAPSGCRPSPGPFQYVTAPPVGLSSGWTSIDTVLKRTQQDELVCQPSYVLVFNLTMAELAQGCSCLRDLSVTNADGEYSSDAEHLARILSVVTMLPADVPLKKTLPSAFVCGEHTQPRSMVMWRRCLGQPPRLQRDCEST